MKTLIIDDDATATVELVGKLKKYDLLEICGTVTTGEMGLKMAQEMKPEIIFLDIELPDMLGTEFLERIETMIGNGCRVVIYTAHSCYMLPSFRNRAFDYLMKPIDDDDLDGVISRVTSKQAFNEEDDNRDEKKELGEKLLFFTNTSDFRLVHLKDIGLFQYNHNQRIWEVVIAGKQEPLRLKRNTNNENLLALDKRFVQVSQRYIININYLLEVNDNFCLFYPPFDKIEYVKVGRFYRKKLIDRFNSL